MPRYSRFAYDYRSLHGVLPGDDEVEDAEFTVVEDRSGLQRALGAGSPPAGRDLRAEDLKFQRLARLGLGVLFAVLCVVFGLLVGALIAGLGMLVATAISLAT
jgi:hypothetical protein